MKLEVVIILGGSPLQRDLIEAANKSYYVIILDGNANCALKEIADEFEHLDFSNLDKVLKFAKTKNPKHILTTANEKGNIIAAIVSKKLGLYYNSIETVMASINKIEMKDRLSSANIGTARYFPLRISDDLKKIPNDFHFPLIVKPAQSSAGRGVKLVYNFNELSSHALKAQKVSENGFSLVEEFVEGDQYSVETVSVNGIHSIIGITKEFFSSAPYFMETQHLFPADLSSSVESKIHDIVFKVLDVFLVEVGSCHIELRLSKNGDIFIIEIATRLGGWRSELANRALGLNIAEIMLDAYGKKEINTTPNRSKFSLVKMLYAKADKTKEEKLREETKYHLDPVVHLSSGFKKEKTSVMDSAGYYYLTAETLEDIYEAL
tara:strand:+ start:451 stop:1584 length:1134 start_codon:yes stop_codon:yes gene_type:complete